MNDTWNAAGVSWSNEEIERELAKVEAAGKMLADRFLRDKIVLLLVVLAALAACIFYLEPITALAVELVILLVMSNYLRKAGRRAQEPMYQMCDPFLEFAYIRAYTALPTFKTKSTMARQVLALAQCMALAGEPQAAIAIQRNIENPDSLKTAEKCIYYNTLLLCYGLCGWVGRRTELCAELKRIRDAAGKREAMQFDVILRLEELKRRQDEGDIGFVEEYFKRTPPMYRFQEVGMHYSLGMMYIKNGDAEHAREHVEFVLEKGNKLYYKRTLEEYLRSSLEGSEPHGGAKIGEDQWDRQEARGEDGR